MSLRQFGFHGADHLGITVPNLEEAVEFFVGIIGCDYIFDGGDCANDPKLMKESLNVDPSSRFRYCFLRCGNGANLEIFEYSAPDQQTVVPRNSDIGGHHLAVYVDDIDSSVDFLRSNEIEVLGEINTVSSGPAAGARWVYFLAPWGLQLELVCCPDGRSYEEKAQKLLWHPKFPSRR